MADASHPDDVVGKAYDARLMRRLLAYLRPHALVVGAALVLIIASSVVELAQPWITQRAIDEGMAAGNFARVASLAWLYLALILAAFGLEYAQTYLLQATGQRVMRALRLQVYAHMQRLDVAFYDKHPVGRLMTRVTTDVDALNDLFTSGVITVVGDVLVLVGIMVAMLLMNWRLALVAFVVLPFIVWTARWFRDNVRQSYRTVRGLVARLNAFLQEHLTGMATVQIFSQEPRVFQRFASLNLEHRNANVASIFYYAVFYPVIESLAAVSVGLIVWIGGGWAEDGTVSVGVLVAFLQYSRRFFQPIADLSEKFNIMQAAMAASERIFIVLDTPAHIESPATARVPSGTPRGRIEFDHVWFAYTDEQFILKDVSFVVEPGERIGIVGATGSGKTTILNLLLRFYDVNRGRILVDGIDVREWDLAALRRLFGLVLQDVHLFSGTIAENIQLGDKTMTREAVEEAARAVHAHGFVEARPDAYDGTVTERGSTFSVGQKQLLSFARALAARPGILLLDEATSSIDTATEALIEDALRVMMAGRTVVAIAHRLSTIQDVDRILVMHKGELRETGTHQALVAARGLYYRLYELQYAHNI